MSKAYDLIAKSLNEIITDLEENDGKKLKRETVLLKIENKTTLQITLRGLQSPKE